MDVAANFLDFLKSKPALTFGFLALPLGFVCGIIWSRWRRKSVRITRLESLETEFVRLHEELERLVQVVGRLWEKANPGSMGEAQGFRPKNYVMRRQSRTKTFYKRTVGKIIRKVARRKKAKAPDATSRVAAMVAQLKSQTDKLSRAESLLPSHPQELPKILRNAETSKSRDGFDIPEDFDLPDAGSRYLDWRKRRESRTNEPEADPILTSGEHVPIAHDELVELYNHAVADNFAREEFRERYQPIRLGTVNAVERRQNPTAEIKPEFRETTDGDFFAFPSSGATAYRVIPRLGLTIGAVSYNAGALGEMFGNPNYDPARSYSRYRVLEPAIFKRDGENWEIIESGQLDLGAPD